EREEAPRFGDGVAIPDRRGDLLGRDVALVDGVLDAQGDEIAVSRRVGDVAGAQEGGGRKGAAHRPELRGALRADEGPGRPGSLRIVRRAERVALPLGTSVC